MNHEMNDSLFTLEVEGGCPSASFRGGEGKALNNPHRAIYTPPGAVLVRSSSQTAHTGPYTDLPSLRFCLLCGLACVCLSTR